MASLSTDVLDSRDMLKMHRSNTVTDETSVIPLVAKQRLSDKKVMSENLPRAVPKSTVTFVIYKSTSPQPAVIGYVDLDPKSLDRRRRTRQRNATRQYEYPLPLLRLLKMLTAHAAGMNRILTIIFSHARSRLIMHRDHPLGVRGRAVVAAPPPSYGSAA